MLSLREWIRARAQKSDRSSVYIAQRSLARVMYDSDPERKSETPLLTEHPLRPAVPLLRPILSVPPLVPLREVRSPVNVASASRRRRTQPLVLPPSLFFRSLAP